MATNVVSETLLKPLRLFVKNRKLEHEQPVGTKYEHSKHMARDVEKRDSSHKNSSIKKTPKGKNTDSHEKMLDPIMNTMTNVTEKLATMDERIIGLA